MQLDNQRPNLDPEGLGLLNIWRKRPKNLLHVALSALLYIVAFTTFLAKANVIALGLSGFITAFIYIDKQLLLPYFSLIVSLINLPLLFAFKRLLPKRLLILTGYWLIFQIIFQELFYLSGLTRFLSSISLFNPRGGHP